MAILGIIFMVLGLIIGLIGGIWLLVLAFKESVLWGLCCLLVPFASIVFIIMHWSDAYKPFLVSLAASAVYGLSFVFFMLAGA